MTSDFIIFKMGTQLLADKGQKYVGIPLGLGPLALVSKLVGSKGESFDSG